MPRPKIHLEPHLDQIRTWIEDDKLHHPEVITRLAQDHNIKLHHRTLRRFLAENDISTSKDYAKDADLNARITQLHYQVQCSDAEALRLLGEEGFKVDKRRFQRMRWRLGLKQRATALKPEEEGPLKMRNEIKDARRAMAKFELLERRLAMAGKRVDALTTELQLSEAANRGLVERLALAEQEIGVLRMRGGLHYEALLP